MNFLVEQVDKALTQVRKERERVLAGLRQAELDDIFNDRWMWAKQYEAVCRAEDKIRSAILSLKQEGL